MKCQRKVIQHHLPRERRRFDLRRGIPDLDRIVSCGRNPFAVRADCDRMNVVGMAGQNAERLMRFTSQIRRVSSEEPDTSHSPLGATPRECTRELPSVPVQCGQFAAAHHTSHSLSVPFQPPDASSVPSGLNATP